MTRDAIDFSDVAPVVVQRDHEVAGAVPTTEVAPSKFFVAPHSKGRQRRKKRVKRVCHTCPKAGTSAPGSNALGPPSPSPIPAPKAKVPELGFADRSLLAIGEFLDRENQALLQLGDTFGRRFEDAKAEIVAWGLMAVDPRVQAAGMVGALGDAALATLCEETARSLGSRDTQFWGDSCSAVHGIRDLGKVGEAMLNGDFLRSLTRYDPGGMIQSLPPSQDFGRDVIEAGSGMGDVLQMRSHPQPNRNGQR